MRIYEITDNNRVLIALKGMSTKFLEEYDIIESAYKIVGNSVVRKQRLNGSVNNLILKIEEFFKTMQTTFYRSYCI